jgi:adenylyltransferase/sulfurtransferase
MKSAHTRPPFGLAALVTLLLAAAPALAEEAIGLDQTRLAVLGDAISKDQDLVDSDELARWIIEERQDFQLIDIRLSERFQDGHIQGAVNIPLRKLFDKAQIASLPRERLILLYGDRGLRAAQAAAMLRLAGLDAYALRGGFAHWALHTLNPEAAAVDASSYQRLDAARRDAIARALKQCDTPCPLPEPDPGSRAGYTPPLSPVEQPPTVPEESSAGVLLDVGC